MIPPPPNESTATCRQIAEGVEIVLPAVGFRRLRFPLFFFAFVNLFSLGMAGVALRFFFDARGAVRDLGSTIFFAVYLSFSLFMAVLTAHAFVWYWAAMRRTAEIGASRERLTLTIRGRWRTTSHLWERDRLLGFDADLHGLWIFDTGRPKAWLVERPQPELRWLAESLGAAFDLPSREPKREGEIDVHVELHGKDAANAFGLDLRDDKVQHARLAVQPGRMVLRLAANRLHQWRFFQPRRTWWRLPEWMRILHLAVSRLTPLEEDALSWQSDDDAIWMEITAPHPYDISLRLWSDDPEIFMATVERFWPADDPPIISAENNPSV